tara:strand:+ start:70 stop:543 length:474 start_codon:yes stop_codon:yes gene_type:complete
MAVTAATLTTTVSESITLNGTTYGNTVTKTHGSVKIVRQQIISVLTTGEVTLYNALGTGTGTTFDDDSIVYVRVTNTDNTNFIALVLENESGDEFQYRVNPGTSFLLSAHSNAMEGTAAGADVTAGTFTDGADAIKNVTAIANTASVDVEVLIAATA